MKNTIASADGGYDVELSEDEAASVLSDRKKAAENEAASRYKEDRRVAYPSTEEQLDMQYWDKMNGTSIWVDHVTKVKAAYPKPAR